MTKFKILHVLWKFSHGCQNELQTTRFMWAKETKTLIFHCTYWFMGIITLMRLIIMTGQYNSPIYIKYPRVLVTKPCRILRRLQGLHVSPNKTMTIIPTHKNHKMLIKLEFMIFRGKPWIHYICTNKHVHHTIHIDIQIYTHKLWFSNLMLLFGGKKYQKRLGSCFTWSVGAEMLTSCLVHSCFQHLTALAKNCVFWRFVLRIDTFHTTAK